MSTISIDGNPKINNLPPASGRILREDDTIRNIAHALYEDPDGQTQFGEIDILHLLVHMKKMHTISMRTLVPQNGFCRLLLRAPVNKDLHIRIHYSCEDFAFFNTYANPTNIVGGTPIVPFNRVLGAPSDIGGIFTRDITSFTAGASRGQDFIGSSGASAQRAGGQGAADIESIISAGNSMLLELQRTDTGSKYAGFIVNLYERSPLSG